MSPQLFLFGWKNLVHGIFFVAVFLCKSYLPSIFLRLYFAQSPTFQISFCSQISIKIKNYNEHILARVMIERR